jgi:hypothetical protein
MYLGDGEKSYQPGQRFRYPREAGKLCPWLLGSMHSTLQTLMQGGTLPWRYAGTPYEKVIDPEGSTTDFISCTDPTAAGLSSKSSERRSHDLITRPTLLYMQVADAVVEIGFNRRSGEELLFSPMFSSL